MLTSTSCSSSSAAAAAAAASCLCRYDVRLQISNTIGPASYKTIFGLSVGFLVFASVTVIIPFGIADMKAHFFVKESEFTGLYDTLTLFPTCSTSLFSGSLGFFVFSLWFVCVFFFGFVLSSSFYGCASCRAVNVSKFKVSLLLSSFSFL